MRKIIIEDFLKNRILSNLVVNPEETFGVYFENIFDIDLNVCRKEVILLEIGTLETKKMKLDFEPNDFFFNDEILIFKVINSSSTKLYSFDLKVERLKEIITLPFELKETLLTKESIYFSTTVQKNHKIGNIEVSEKCPFYQEGYGVTGETITGLFKSSYDGKNIKMITSLDMNIDQVDFDAENKRIMFTVFKTNPLKSIDSDVYTYDMNTEEFKLHTSGNYRISFIKSMSENNLIFTGVDLKNRSRNDNQQLYLVDMRKNKFEILGDYVDKSNEESSVITDSAFSTSSPVLKYGDWFYHIRIERDREILYRINLSGNTEIVETGLKKIDSYRVLNDGILIIGLKDLNLHEVYLFNKNSLTKITSHNDWLYDITLSNVEKLKANVDDVEIDGYVFKPAEFDENKKYPGILIIHGGPKMIYSDVFIHDVQVLCANGYFVFYGNPRGSDGRGDEFSNIRGNFGSTAYLDLMELTDTVLEKYPQLDRNFLGVTGGSYGGYMTNYIITKTSRFKAAISERGISNMITAFTSSDIGYKFIYEYMGNKDTPWTNPLLYMEESPINLAHKVTTPTLFIHGKNDYRCHYTESLNMYSALNYLGIESRFSLFDGENHSLSGKGRPQSRKKRYEEILDWFNKFLKEENSNGFNYATKGIN